MLHLRNRRIRVVEAGPGLISKYHMRSVMMVTVRVRVYQNVLWVTMIRDQSGASIWILERYPANTECSWTMQTKIQRLIRLINSAMDAEKNLFPFMIQWWTRSSFHVVVFRCPRKPWVRLLVSRSWRRIFYMSPCDTSVILDSFLRKSPRPENQTMISIITGWIFIGMISTLV